MVRPYRADDAGHRHYHAHVLIIIERGRGRVATEHMCNADCDEDPADGKCEGDMGGVVAMA